MNLSQKLKIFFLTEENFSEMQELLATQLEQLKIAPKDISRTQLLVEEIFWRMVNNGNCAQVKVKVTKNFFGKVQVQMTAEGAPYNPLVEVTDWDEEDEDYLRTIILKANRQKLNWFHEKNLNVIKVDVFGESNDLLWTILAAMLGGTIFGFVMSEFFSPEAISFIKENIITPIETMTFNALSMVIAPVIFFSIINGITSLGAGANVGKIGSKVIVIYFLTMIMSVILALPVGMFFLQDSITPIATVPENISANSYQFSLVKFIVDIVPPNLVSPVINGNLLQVIFAATLFGICLNSLGDKVKNIREIVSGLNELFMKVVEVIIKLVPLIAFFAMITLVTETGVETFLSVLRLLVLMLLCYGTLFVIYMFLIRVLGKISPLPFLKKIPSLWMFPFVTNSSAATIPMSMKFCTEKMGVSPTISSFSIPVGATINMNGLCIFMLLISVMLIRLYGVEVDWNDLIIISAMTISMSIGCPGVPNACIVCVLSIITTFGVPNDAAGLVFCINAICERFVTVANVTGDIAMTFLVARSENFTDEKIYLS